MNLDPTVEKTIAALMSLAAIVVVVAIVGVPDLENIAPATIPLLVYFLPAIFAGSRRHHNAGAIFATNLLLGWTILGWIVALIWASTNPPAK